MAVGVIGSQYHLAVYPVDMDTKNSLDIATVQLLRMGEQTAVARTTYIVHVLPVIVPRQKVMFVFQPYSLFCVGFSRL